jgi:hypothetical protein
MTFIRTLWESMPISWRTEVQTGVFAERHGLSDDRGLRWIAGQIELEDKLQAEWERAGL